MPNWSYNRLVVEGDREALARFADAVSGIGDDGGRMPLDFERHLPTPPELLDPDRSREPGTLPDWRNWRSTHWGTKWNALYAYLEDGVPAGQLVYRFQTAYSPPIPWAATVSRVFPQLSFTLEAVEEFLQFSGRLRFEDGELVDDVAVDPELLGWVELEEDAAEDE